MPLSVVNESLRVEKGWTAHVGFLKRSKPRPQSNRLTEKIQSTTQSCARHCVEHSGRNKRYQGVERRRDSSRDRLHDPASPSPDKPTFLVGEAVYLKKKRLSGFVVADHRSEHSDGSGAQCIGSGDCVEVIIVDSATNKPADTTIHMPFCSVEVVIDLNRPKRCDLSAQPVDLIELNRELQWLITQMKFGNPAASDIARRLEIQNALERWEAEAEVTSEAS